MSLNKLSRSDMENILVAYGFEDAARFGTDEMITLISELGVEVPEQTEEVNHPAVPSPTLENTNLPPATPADSAPTVTESVLNAPERPNLVSAPDLTAEGARNEVNTEGDAMRSSNSPLFIPDVSSNNSNNVGMSDEEEVKLSTFCDISSSDKDFARSILESLGWDLDSAIAIYLEGGIQVPPKPIEPAPFVSSAFTSSTFRTDDINANQGSLDLSEDSNRQSTSHPDLSEMIARLQQQHRMHYHEEDEDDDEEDHNVISYGGFGDPSRRHQQRDDNKNDDELQQQQFYDDGVRVRTDPVRTQRLISRQYSNEQDHIMLGRADDPSVEWMVDPPRHLSYMGSLEHAKTKANEEGRWILVNIQSHEAWVSNELNRTFQDETIECILRGQYLFWQRGHTSHDGQEFMRLYKINAEDLPLMFIIEPNTGARLKTFKGYIEPADLASSLIEFHEKNAHSLQNYVHSPKGAPSSTLKDADSNVKDTGSAEIRSAERTQTVGSSAVAAPAPPAVPSFDPSIYGEVPSIPGDKEAGTVRVAVKLPTRRIQRRFRENDTIRALFAYVASEDEESRQRGFDLVNPGPPPLNLQTMLDERIISLNGVCVNHKWA